MRATIAAMDPELVVHRAAPMTEVVGRGVSRERFALVLMGTFAGVSLMLAVLGLYGVLAYTVRQRTQEIGIRMALGATATQVRVLVLRQAALVLAIGLVVGIAGAMVLGRWLSSLVFEISPSDPRIILATVFLLTATGFLRGVAARTARFASGTENRDAGRLLTPCRDAVTLPHSKAVLNAINVRNRFLHMMSSSVAFGLGGRSQVGRSRSPRDRAWPHHAHRRRPALSVDSNGGHVRASRFQLVVRQHSGGIRGSPRLTSNIPCTDTRPAIP